MAPKEMSLKVRFRGEFGVNWHPMRYVKVQVNVVREHLADPAIGPAPDSPSFWSRVVRFQLAF